MIAARYTAGSGMSATTRPCSQCGGVMHYRLGDDECENCTHREPGKSPVMVDEPRPTAAIAHAAPSQVLRSTQDIRTRNLEPEKYDPAPGLEREKSILFAIYAGRVVLTL